MKTIIALANVTAMLMGLIFYAALSITTNIFWASIWFLPLMAIYVLFVRFFWVATPVIFFIIFGWLTFSPIGLVRSGHTDNSIASWVAAHPSCLPERNQYEKMYPAAFDATRLQDSLRYDWLQSNGEQVISNYATKTDVSTAQDFDEAWANMKEWFKNHNWRTETPPIPTEDFMISYCCKKHNINESNVRSFIDIENKAFSK